MSAFPSLTPNIRLFTPGDSARAEFRSLSGKSSFFRRGDVIVGQTLSLEYSHLAEAEMLLIKNHYYNSNGSFDTFFLSREIWADHETLPIPINSDFVWRYAAPPSIVDASFDRFNVNVKLVSEPIDLGDLIIDGSVANPSNPFRIYIVDGLTAAETPLRELIIEPGGAA
jgi:hypothetical protein